MWSGASIQKQFALGAGEELALTTAKCGESGRHRAAGLREDVSQEDDSPSAVGTPRSRARLRSRVPVDSEGVFAAQIVGPDLESLLRHGIVQTLGAQVAEETVEFEHARGGAGACELKKVRRHLNPHFDGDNLGLREQNSQLAALPPG
jgi:hypothetical protein